MKSHKITCDETLPDTRPRRRRLPPPPVVNASLEHTISTEGKCPSHCERSGWKTACGAGLSSSQRGSRRHNAAAELLAAPRSDRQ